MHEFRQIRVSMSWNFSCEMSSCSNPNSSKDSALPIHWDSIIEENPTLNYVFTSDEPKMTSKLFEVLKGFIFYDLHLFK